VTPPRPIEIIGGGLAGLALGLGLRAHGVPVTLVEAGTYPRHRVCGEFITGLDAATRRELQLDPHLADARLAHHVTWHDEHGVLLRQSLPEPALCLSRHTLDARLAAAFVAAGGHLQTGQRVSLDPQPGRVLACGRRPEPQSRWVGLKQHYQGLTLADDLELHLGRGAYIGLTRVEADVVNVCGLFPRPTEATAPARVLLQQLEKVGLRPLAARLTAARAVPDSACAVAGLAYAPARNRGISLGDHHGLIPPFTGHGMTLALQGAATALPHLVGWARGESDWPATELAIARALHRRFHRRLTWGRRLHPWLLSPRRLTILRGLHRLRLLPLRPLYHLVH
jgi:menaquinone-9 beta-reductase